jgi:tetratricopeptide (TPR) repeat protein
MAQLETGPALWEALFGNAAEATGSARDVLRLSKDRDAEYGAALALALAGDTSEPPALAADLEKRFPEDTVVRFSYLPTLKALLALRRGDPSGAVEELRAAAPFELGAPPAFRGALYAVYARGEAYLASQRGAEAAAEFRKILDHRGIVADDPVGAVARLALGRALVLAGDKAGAKAAYEDFLTLWKDADPDIPILKQARAEDAALR